MSGFVIILYNVHQTHPLQGIMIMYDSCDMQLVYNSLFAGSVHSSSVECIPQTQWGNYNSNNYYIIHQYWHYTVKAGHKGSAHHTYVAQLSCQIDLY